MTYTYYIIIAKYLYIYLKKSLPIINLYQKYINKYLNRLFIFKKKKYNKKLLLKQKFLYCVLYRTVLCIYDIIIKIEHLEYFTKSYMFLEFEILSKKLFSTYILV